MQNLGPWLLSVPGFVQRLHAVVAESIFDELGSNFDRDLKWRALEHDWRYLLLAASILAGSKEGACQSAALRIAQTCLTRPDMPLERRDGAGLVLDMLANHPGMKLAFDRGFLQPDLERRLPAPARIEWTRRLMSDSVLLGDGETLRVNRFQRLLWEGMVGSRVVSASAPTSAGKSFIVTRWIREVFQESPSATIIYLVPTRALITQVERDIMRTLGDMVQDVHVSSIPIPDTLSKGRGRVLVFTQERMHILLAKAGAVNVDVLIVDEAHKIGDRHRGVLLQDVIERVTVANSEVRVVFASPMTSNPEVLLEDAGAQSSGFSFSSEDATVSQNLLWVSQVEGQPRNWEVFVCLANDQLRLGTLSLGSTPSSVSKRLSFIAHAVGQEKGGNVVYVNGAAEAEKIAIQIYDLLGPGAESGDRSIRDLIELAQRTVHKRFLLATVLRRGVAFHYGNLPPLIRAEIERLFSEGVIRYLVCTSTLVEGVNMSCRSIFLRGPKKGRGKPMSVEDFWNLAGRAGRWGKEFQGNVICIDADKIDVWGENGAPRVRARYAISRTTDSVLQTSYDLIDYIRDGTPKDSLDKKPELEYVFSYLVSLHYRYGSVLRSPWANRFNTGELANVASVIGGVVGSLKTPLRVVDRNPGINPFAMDLLLDYFEKRKKPVEELLPVDPADAKAVSAYTAIFIRISRFLNPRLGPSQGRSAILARTVVQWMRGFPLSRLVTERVRYHSQQDKPLPLATVIRYVMEEVEQIARFEAPKSLACYRDLLEVHLQNIGRSELVDNLPDLDVLLELGVAQRTQIALIGIGLSRTSAIALADLIGADDLAEDTVIDWINENRLLWGSSDIPALVKREIENVLSLAKVNRD